MHQRMIGPAHFHERNDLCSGKDIVWLMGHALIQIAQQQWQQLARRTILRVPEVHADLPVTVVRQTFAFSCSKRISTGRNRWMIEALVVE